MLTQSALYFYRNIDKLYFLFHVSLYTFSLNTFLSLSHRHDALSEKSQPKRKSSTIFFISEISQTSL